MTHCPMWTSVATRHPLSHTNIQMSFLHSGFAHFNVFNFCHRLLLLHLHTMQSWQPQISFPEFYQFYFCPHSTTNNRDSFWSRFPYVPNYFYALKFIPSCPPRRLWINLLHGVFWSLWLISTPCLSYRRRWTDLRPATWSTRSYHFNAGQPPNRVMQRRPNRERR